MINSLWVSKTGMEAQQMQLDTISNNLANVSTTGFKRSNVAFEDLMYQNLRQVGGATSEQSQLPTGLQLGTGVRVVGTARQFTQGNVQQTGNNLDVAIQGNGFFQVTMPDGTIGYTRDGSFKINAQGQVVTNNGYAVANGITVPTNAENLVISADGTVTASIKESGKMVERQIGTIALASFINPAGLDPRGQNIYIETVASGQPNTSTPGLNGMGHLMQGYLETSNVNVVQELVTMIQTQRAYEMNSKAIQTSDQMLQKLGQL